MQSMLSHYRIVEQIGAGGMGVVFLAHDERLQRDVALKVLPPRTVSDPDARKRFVKEALTLSKLNHPNIATVFDFDTHNGTDFLVTEYIPGVSLDHMLAGGPLPEKEIVHLGSQLAEGLRAAHEQGIIHLDLKPANLRITRDVRLKILDFGLAKMLHTEPNPTIDTESVTGFQSVRGTPPYMAPEQLLEAKQDERTDIWAVGCVLYEMATGRRPFLGSGPALIDAILHQPPPPPSEVNAQISWGLEAIILKCLEGEPALRYHSAREIAVDLLRLTAPSSIGRAIETTRRGRSRKLAKLVAMVALFLAIAGLAFWLGRKPQKPPAPEGVAPSIAVLPFVDMSAKKDQEYFSDGLSEELIDSLAKVPGLRVAARTSSFQFKERNARLVDIGRELKVATVLEGSVRKEGRRVRISVQLVKVSDGFHLWSETYDRELTDIFTLQEEIARAAAGSLKVTLLGGRTRAAPAQPEAYSAYLRGRYWRERRGQKDLEKSVTYYQQAVEIDPGYALAWAGLAGATRFQATISYRPFGEGCQAARQAAERALSLDPNLAEAHLVMAEIKTMCDWDWSGAEAALKRAAELEPGHLGVMEMEAQLNTILGRFDEALALRRRVVDKDPLNPSARLMLGTDAFSAGRLQEAVAAFQKALELNPGNAVAHASLGRVYLAQSRVEEALAEAQRETLPGWRLQGLALAYHALGKKKESDAALTELTARFHLDMAFQIAEMYGFRGETDQALRWLERAYAQRDAGLTAIKGDPFLRSVKRDPRYVALLRKMRLPLD